MRQQESLTTNSVVVRVIILDNIVNSQFTKTPKTDE